MKAQGFVVQLLGAIEELKDLLESLADRSVLKHTKNAAFCDGKNEKFNELDQQMLASMQALKLDVRIDGASGCCVLPLTPPLTQRTLCVTQRWPRPRPRRQTRKRGRRSCWAWTACSCQTFMKSGSCCRAARCRKLSPAFRWAASAR